MTNPQTEPGTVRIFILVGGEECFLHVPPGTTVRLLFANHLLQEASLDLPEGSGIRVNGRPVTDVVLENGDTVEAVPTGGKLG